MEGQAAGHKVIRDAVWGEIEVTERVLWELIDSAPVQRLKEIHQAGASYYTMPSRRSLTRYAHSVGVMLLLRRLGASLEEQVAGLLHDVPHTAFSHTVDIVFPNDEHNFHERFQHAVIMQSEIPAILEKHGLPLDCALEPDRYPLLEQPLPALCADRLDYTLRDMAALGYTNLTETGPFAASLRATAQGPACTSVGQAAWFARLFMRANEELYTSPDDAGAYWALAGAIRRAYEVGKFNDSDLFSTDEQAMAKLRASTDPTVAAYLTLLRPGVRFYPVPDNGPFFTTLMKQRVVDPPVWQAETYRTEPLSRLSPEYAAVLAGLPKDRSVVYKLWSRDMPQGLPTE